MELNEMNLQTPSETQNREKGVTTVEYAVMLVLVAIAVLLFGAGINQSITDVFQSISDGLGA